MNVFVASLPSNGTSIYPSTTIRLEPLTYRQLAKYGENTYTTDLDKLVWDIEHLIQDIPNWVT